VILSSALWKNYLPLLVVATYVIAPLPNFICGRFSNPDDFMDSAGSAAVTDFGRFCTGFLVVMGIGRSKLSLYFDMWEARKWADHMHGVYIVRSAVSDCFKQLYRLYLHTAG
jgi:hypothetical protein